MKTRIGILVAVAALAAGAFAPPDAVLTGPRRGLLESNTLFTVYGRGFGTAPILGHLGTYKNFDEMEADTRTWDAKITGVNGNKGVVNGVHLIYALAVPCTGSANCLLYLGGGIVEKYIKPAAERGWVVVLDDQLGKSDPVTEIKRMIDRGYLKYDNVHVAFDPEFHVVEEGQNRPGIPIGTVQASQINEAQELLDRYVQQENLKTKKILMVHQFGDANVRDGVPFMIQDKKTLKDFENVELVIDADGLGSPFIKVHKYNRITDSRVYPFIRFRGIKVFFPNEWEKHGHFDKPPMTVDEVFGITGVPGGIRMSTKPNVFIIA